MAVIALEKLSSVTKGLLAAAGLTEENAATVAEVFMRATARGVAHHDITALPGRLAGIAGGKIKPNPDMRLIARRGAMEAYEGDRGLGELNAMFVTRRCIELAREHGIALCTIRNSNHILASSPYVEVAAEAGLLGYVVTRGAPTMGAPGRRDKVIGTAPQGFAIPTGKNHNLMFDACLAYTSFGALQDMADRGTDMPPYWGLDADGKPSGDPAAVMKGTRLPIGGHKGFGLAILGELLTGLLSDGQIIDEPQEETGDVGMPSHTAICFDAGGLIGGERLRSRTAEMIDRMRARAPGLTIPGERSYQSKAKAAETGAVEVDDAAVARLNEWCGRLGVGQLIIDN